MKKHVQALCCSIAILGSLQSGEGFGSEHYDLERIRVFYETDGVAAVKQADLDRNGVPDQVDDIARQVWATHDLFSRSLGFVDPFDCERYPNIQWIEVQIRDRDSLKNRGGVAYSNYSKAQALPGSESSGCVLKMSIASDVNAIKSITPGHEMFHLIQYSTTHFKNAWFLEGLARWSEHTLERKGLGEFKYSPRGPWPQRRSNLPQLFGMKYDAEFALWNPVARATDQQGLLTRMQISDRLKILKYSDGSPVLKDAEFVGWPVIRDVLIELAKADDIAFRELGYEEWTEKNQTSPDNDDYIYKSVMDALRKYGRVGAFRIRK
jgi:hypothetical protein